MELDPMEIKSLKEKETEIETKIAELNTNEVKKHVPSSFELNMAKIENSIQKVELEIERAVDLEERKLLRKEKEQLREQLILLIQKNNI
jgi:hypothetical protein